LKLIQNSDVLAAFQNYPLPVREKLLRLRQLIIDTASELESLEILEETFKWGEPSYVTRVGSTIRMNCVKSNSNQYALYFHCKTKLVDTFKELYSDHFIFDGNRAIIFNVNDDSHFEDVVVEKLKHCISLSLNYHKIKHLPILGA